MLRDLGLALGIAFSTREIAQAAEAYTTIANRLALVTSSAQELADAQDAVFRIAQEGRQPLGETAELYQRIATNADQLNLSAAGVEAVVDTINKTLAISGTTGQAASAALVQLGQAFASGTLRGEELNSVLEQAPALARTLSDGLGVTVGELRALGMEGKLTAQNVVQALLAQSGAVDEQFSKIQTTGAQAMTVLGNSLTRVIGELNTATGASASFGDALLDVANWLDSGALTDGALDMLAIWGGTFDAISADVASLELDFDSLAEGGENTAQFLARAFKELPVNLRSAVQLATTEILALFDRAVAYATFTGEAIRSAFDDAGRKAADQELQARLEQINSVRDASINTILEERDAILDAAAADRERREEERKSREASRQQRLKDIAALREQAKAGGVTFGAGTDTEADAKRAKEAQKYVEQLERQAATLGLNAAEVRRYELAEKELTSAMLDRAQAALALIDANEAQRQADANARANAGLEAEFLRASGRETDAALLEIRTKFAAQRIELEKVGNEAGLAWLDKLIPVAEAKVRVDEVSREMQRILNDAQRQEQSVNVQQDAGLITELQARERILEIHQQTAAQLEKMQPVLTELAQRPGEIGEAASGLLSQVNDYILRAQEGANTLKQTLEDGLTNGLTQALNGLADGTMTLRDAVTALGQAVLDALTKMAAQEVANSLTSSVMGLFGGAGGAGAAGGGTSWLSTLMGLGGMFFGGPAGAAAGAGSGSFLSSVMASRFADGGHVRGPGTATSDSIPAWLSDYEYVVRASVVQQPGALAHLDALNTYGMAALDGARVRHNTGGLAGYPAPAMPSPGLGTSRLAEPAKGGSTTIKNGVNLYAIQRPEDIAAMAWSDAGKQHFAVYLQQEGAQVRQLLGL
ncbi:tape measure protein [Pseudomonas sp. C11]|uniref:tape measure protein n=1 Tax=Pseudomonas sp. C11 TaxID=3075550 RepID=UPI002AFF9B39|nr:tape measure protein [Pseudomonas sp. C11]